MEGGVMDEKQKKKFEEWWSEFDKTRMLEMYAPRTIAQKAWEACLEANEVEEQEPEPTPTEMVRRLLDKGWEVESDANEITIFRDPNCTYGTSSAIRAYRKAFPRKKKVEVVVYKDLKPCPNNCNTPSSVP